MTAHPDLKPIAKDVNGFLAWLQKSLASFGIVTRADDSENQVSALLSCDKPFVDLVSVFSRPEVITYLASELQLPTSEIEIRSVSLSDLDSIPPKSRPFGTLQPGLQLRITETSDQ